jgi:hypothetical protein
MLFSVTDPTEEMVEFVAFLVPVDALLLERYQIRAYF